MTKRVALYLRVSTSEQTTKNQRRELIAVAKRQGWNVVEIFEDAGGQSLHVSVFRMQRVIARVNSTTLALHCTEAVRTAPHFQEERQRRTELIESNHGDGSKGWT